MEQKKMMAIYCRTEAGDEFASTASANLPGNDIQFLPEIFVYIMVRNWLDNMRS